MSRTRKIKSSAEIEAQIKALQQDLVKAKANEEQKRFSFETKKRLNAILDNHGVHLTDAEMNAIMNPIENCERLYYLEVRKHGQG